MVPHVQNALGSGGRVSSDRRMGDGRIVESACGTGMFPDRGNFFVETPGPMPSIPIDIQIVFLESNCNYTV